MAEKRQESAENRAALDAVMAKVPQAKRDFDLALNALRFARGEFEDALYRLESERNVYWGALSELACRWLPAEEGELFFTEKQEEFSRAIEQVKKHRKAVKGKMDAVVVGFEVWRCDDFRETREVDEDDEDDG